MATERQRAWNRRMELSLNENFCFSDQHRKLRGAFSFLGQGRRGNRLELSVNERACEAAGRVRQGDEAAMEPQQGGGTRRPTTRTHTVITRAAIVVFYVAVVHVTYVTDFCRVGIDGVVYPSWGTTLRNFNFLGTGVVAALQSVR